VLIPRVHGSSGLAPLHGAASALSIIAKLTQVLNVHSTLSRSGWLGKLAERVEEGLGDMFNDAS